MILILGGTAEARRFGRLVAGAELEATISMAGATLSPAPQALPTRIGGFGGEEGLRSYLRDNHVLAVIDMTHPFARQMTARAAQVCAALDLPYLRFERLPWVPCPGAQWTHVSDPALVAEAVPEGARILLTTGPGSAEKLGLEGRDVICRRIDLAEGRAPEGWRWLVARPPFSLEDELALMRRERITLLIAKNSGGGDGSAKLDAAARLDIPVVMIERPPLPEGIKVVGTLWAALAWAKSMARA